VSVQLRQRLSGEADDMVRLPHGYIAVKNRDSLDAKAQVQRPPGPIS
jgi:hypothetical protein